MILGLVLSGSVAIHDKLRLVSGREELRADVKGIQINDEDYDTAVRGIRVWLSLRGAEVRLQSPVPIWNGMSAAVVDLNAKNLRIAGGCLCKL